MSSYPITGAWSCLSVVKILKSLTNQGHLGFRARSRIFWQELAKKLGASFDFPGKRSEAFQELDKTNKIL